jgi:hypothetical protein
MFANKVSGRPSHAINMQTLRSKIITSESFYSTLAHCVIRLASDCIRMGGYTDGTENSPSKL